MRGEGLVRLGFSDFYHTTNVTDTDGERGVRGGGVDREREYLCFCAKKVAFDVCVCICEGDSE